MRRGSRSIARTFFRAKGGNAAQPARCAAGRSAPRAVELLAPGGPASALLRAVGILRALRARLRVRLRRSLLQGALLRLLLPSRPRDRSARPRRRGAAQQDGAARLARLGKPGSAAPRWQAVLLLQLSMSAAACAKGTHRSSSSSGGGVDCAEVDDDRLCASSRFLGADRCARILREPVAQSSR